MDNTKFGNTPKDGVFVRLEAWRLGDSIVDVFAGQIGTIEHSHRHRLARIHIRKGQGRASFLMVEEDQQPWVLPGQIVDLERIDPIKDAFRMCKSKPVLSEREKQIEFAINLDMDLFGYVSSCTQHQYGLQND